MIAGRLVGTTAAFTSAGLAWPGGAVVLLELADVRAFGIQSVYGDFVSRYVVRAAACAGGAVEAEAFVDGSKQTEAVRKVLRTWAKRVPSVRLTRELGFATMWTSDLSLESKFVVGGRVRVRPRARFRLDWSCRTGDVGVVDRVGQRITVVFENGASYAIKKSDLETLEVVV